MTMDMEELAAEVVVHVVAVVDVVAVADVVAVVDVEVEVKHSPFTTALLSIIFCCQEEEVKSVIIHVKMCRRYDVSD